MLYVNWSIWNMDADKTLEGMSDTIIKIDFIHVVDKAITDSKYFKLENHFSTKKTNGLKKFDVIVKLAVVVHILWFF